MKRMLSWGALVLAGLLAPVPAGPVRLAAARQAWGALGGKAICRSVQVYSPAASVPHPRSFLAGLWGRLGWGTAPRPVAGESLGARSLDLESHGRRLRLVTVNRSSLGLPPLTEVVAGWNLPTSLSLIQGAGRVTGGFQATGLTPRLAVTYLGTVPAGSPGGRVRQALAAAGARAVYLATSPGAAEAAARVSGGLPLVDVAGKGINLQVRVWRQGKREMGEVGAPLTVPGDGGCAPGPGGSSLAGTGSGRG